MVSCKYCKYRNLSTFLYVIKKKKQTPKCETMNSTFISFKFGSCFFNFSNPQRVREYNVYTTSNVYPEHTITALPLFYFLIYDGRRTASNDVRNALPWMIIIEFLHSGLHIYSCKTIIYHY